MDDYDLYKWDLKAVREMAPQGSGFVQGLRTGYLALHDEEDASLDWSDADHFARKAVQSARSLNVQPDQVSLRELSPEHVDELTAARARIMAAFGQEAQRKAPFASARAQVAFDCWLEQQEENDLDDIARCKADFEAAMAEVEDALSSDIDNVYVIFFAWDKTNITPVAEKILDDVMNDVEGGEIVRILLAGHADTSGSAGYNNALSQRRAVAVSNALQARGIAGDMIDVEWFGETQPRVQTGDNVREPQNRRVEIRFAGE
ncbi:MAG: OmpA family protein [Geminicoccaceae bacterium]